MKKFIFILCFILSMSINSFASEFNIGYYQEDNNTHTFISILNPSSVGHYVTVTFRNVDGETVYSKRQFFAPANTKFYDTRFITGLPSYGSINIFIEDNTPGVNMAIIAMLYGDTNMALNVVRY